MQPIIPQQQDQFHSTLSSAPSHASSQQQQQQQQQQHLHHLHSHSPHPSLEHLVQQPQHASYDSAQAIAASHIGLERQQQQQRDSLLSPSHAATYTTTGKQKSSSHYGQRFNPILATTAAVSAQPAAPSTLVAASYSQLSIGQSVPANQSLSYSQGDAQNLFSHGLTTVSGLQGTSTASVGIAVASSARQQPMVHQLSPPARSHDLLIPSWSSSVPTYTQGYESKYASNSGLDAHHSTTVGATAHAGLITNNFYARSLHTPYYQMGLGTVTTEGAQFDYGAAHGPGTMSLFGSSVIDPLEGSRLPTFDVRAYTFRKKSRHYVAVKHKNALRIEPIIYLKTSILDNQREVVRNWDYLRFSIHRFRDNALPKKKLSSEGKFSKMRTARILDVNITLVSPNNKNRLIEESCPACVMRMDGERKIMQVLAKNFKLTPAGEPVIDVRKGHAIVCIKLNCYCDHHNEHEGFVVRMQTEPEVVRLGGSVRLRICCEARSKSGPAEPEVEEEDGLTDIDAPVSTGSRSPLGHDRLIQSPSLSYGSQSPDPRSRQREQSTANSSSVASPRSVDERVVSSLGVGDPLHGQSGGRSVSPPAFRTIYPLTPSEGTCFGGTRVTIHGAHFDVMQNPVVYFGKVPADLVTISHHDVMECTTPAAEGLKPGIVEVRIASQAFPLGAVENDASVDFMYTAPLDYDFYNLAATSLSYAMSNEYPNENSLAYVLGAHGNGLVAGLGQGQMQGSSDTLSGDTLDMGLAWGLNEDILLDFLKAIQLLAPGRVLPAFQSETGHTLLHLAAQKGMIRLARELLAMGIDHTAVDRNRKTARDFAQAVSDADMIQLLSEAKLPPRPMVPRLNASDSMTTNPSSMKDIVESLIQKHEQTLSRALAQEQDRKAKELRQLRDRSLRIMELRDMPVAKLMPPALSIVDIEGDEIAHFSEESSPSTKSLDDDEHSPMDDTTMDEDEDAATDRKRKSREDEFKISDSASKKLATKLDSRLSSKDGAIDPVDWQYVQNGIKRWEDSKATKIFGNILEHAEATDIQIWACESATVTSYKSLTTVESPVTAPIEPVRAVLALSVCGLHLYSEQPSSVLSTPKKLEHWSLAEIDGVMCRSENSKGILQVNLCGLVPRGGRDLTGETIQITAKSETAAFEISRAIERAQNQLTAYQRSAYRDDWTELRLGMWGALFNVDHSELATIIADDILELRNETLVVKAASDNRGHSLAMAAAVFRTARDLQDTCSKVCFKGAKVADNGWARTELIKELEGTVQAMRHVSQWEFSDCGWTVLTADGFINGLKGGASDGESRHRCRKISLAGNRFEGDNNVGHRLAACVDRLQDLESLDVANCDIGVDGMKELVHRLHNYLELRLQGNRADESWWRCMDTVLEMNPRLQQCSLGAPISTANPEGSLLALDRILSLKDLAELDLSNSPISQSTLAILETRVRQDSINLQTLNLSHSGLSWSSLVPIFKAICSVNESTKFTLEISKNPLFDLEDAIQDWETSIAEAQVQVPFGIHMTDLLLSDAVLQRVLTPLENATCFNELNIKGLYVTRVSQAQELGSLSYDEARLKTIPEIASEESCQALGRVIVSNSTLVMLDVSGNLVERPIVHDKVNSVSASETPLSCSSGGLGRNVVLAFPALVQNSTLRVLSVDHNRFGEEGIIDLCKAMRSNTGVGVLSCDGNDAYTPKGLQAAAAIFAPEEFLAEPETRATTPSIPVAEALSLRVVDDVPPPSDGYNSTLSVWKLSPEDILMHMQHLTMEVHRLTGEYNRIEKMQAASMHGEDVKFLGPTPLEDVHRRLTAAETNRIEYSETHARIIRSISQNNRRTKDATASQR
ncbi:hypothetical protein BGZ99_001741 [Dissophora globulifera]|uniref:IPT/TIG domain-containing protein n=1 Tax=Dissophora globulifera TaxID=979702 RepID=A0A9P6UXW5_9FUNG|nr:hypothetical protein BGZ99_001741 [Dissophora globulifera]